MKDSIGNDLLKKALTGYAEGPNLPIERIRGEKQFFEHKILGMKDDKDVPYMFLRHLSLVFNRASNMWFEVLHNEFPKPFYIAIPTIQEKDPEYYDHLMVLCSNTFSSDEKIAAAEWIAQKLFR